jgi:hypothetical protein
VSGQRDVIDYALQRRALLGDVASGRRTRAEAALGKTSGQAKSPAELAQLAATVDEFDVYVVEVCPDCGWNHLIRSYVLGRPTDTSLSAADG